MTTKRIDRTPSGLLEGIASGIATTLSKTLEAPRVEAELAVELERLSVPAQFDHIPFQPGILRARDINGATNRVFIALSALYRAFLLSEVWQTRQIESVASGQNIAERGVTKLLQDIQAYKILKLNPDYNDVRILKFVDARNRARGGTVLQIDPRTRSMRLGELDRSRLHERKQDVEAQIDITYLTDGVNGFSREHHGPENAVDPNEETFWSETTYADDPVTSTFAGTDYPGFGIQVTVDLRQAELINRIDLKPFGSHTPRLLALQTSPDNVTFTSVPGFVEPSQRLLWWTFIFEPTACRYIRVVLLQENYVEHVFHLPRRIAQNQLLFDHIAEERIRFNLGNRTDSNVEDRSLRAREDFGLVLDALGQLEAKLSETRLPSDDSARIRDLDRFIEPILDLVGVQEHSILPSRRAIEEPDELVENHKVEYTAGLFHLEASRSLFYPRGEFISPKFSVEGTVWEVAVDVTPTHVNLTDAMGMTRPATTAEFDVEISPTRRLPIVPKGETSSYEVIPIDPKTFSGRVRFNTTDNSPVLWRNGNPLNLNTDFTFTAATRTLTLLPASYKPGSVYQIVYTPTTGQDVLDLQATFNSFPNTPIDVFRGTDQGGTLTLSHSPFVDYTKINDLDLFTRDTDDSRFIYRSDIAQSTIDGEVWGIGATALSTGVGSEETTIPVDSTAEFASAGTIVVGAETITYTSKTDTSFDDCVRGAGGTPAAAHLVDAAVISHGEMTYDPVLILVDGVRALNKTDYYRGEHPTLDPRSPSSTAYTFIATGPRVYFGSPIADDRVIEVHYRVLAEYVSLRAVFRQASAGQRFYTPDVREARLLINRAEV